MTASILISSYDQPKLFRRTVHAIATRPPQIPFELIVAAGESFSDLLGILQTYSSVVHWKLLHCSTRNGAYQAAFEHSTGEHIFLQRESVIPWGNVYDQLLKEAPVDGCFFCLSSTYKIPPYIGEFLDPYGTNFYERYLPECFKHPLVTNDCKNDLTAHLALTNRNTCLKANRFISGEMPKFEWGPENISISEGISLCQPGREGGQEEASLGTIPQCQVLEVVSN